VIVKRMKYAVLDAGGCDVRDPQARAGRPGEQTPIRTRSNSVNCLAVLTALCMLACEPAWAQSPAVRSPSTQQITSKVEEYMRAAVREGFSGSILLARGGQPLISNGYGMANLELDVPNTPQTEFRLGSLTKSFTAVAVMILQERGKLKVSDSISKHLPDCPAAWQPITIRHLLSHTSGIPDYTELPDYEPTKALPASPHSLLERIRNKPLDFAPGERFKYSNSGYALLGLIIERASGQPYANFLQDNILKVLGMKHTGYDSHGRILKGRATGYTPKLPEGDTLLNASYVDMSVVYAAGALYSTTQDMFLWDQALQSQKLLSRKSLDEIFTPVKGDYAYGWRIMKQFGHPLICHFGRINGFASFLGRFPDDQVTVIVLSNNDGSFGWNAATAMAAIALGEPYEIPQERKTITVAPQVLENYVGRYQLTPDFVLTVTCEDGGLMCQGTGQPKATLYAGSETEFYLKVVEAGITFVKNTDGRVTSLVLHQNGRDLSAKKIN
jgi:CubicO group peptidase (beta-lactamase class C family)